MPREPIGVVSLIGSKCFQLMRSPVFVWRTMGLPLTVQSHERDKWQYHTLLCREFEPGIMSIAFRNADVGVVFNDHTIHELINGLHFHVRV